MLVEASWLKVLQPRVSSGLAACHLANFRSLGEAATQPSPKFVFAHFIPPHHPYLFDRHGNILREANLSNQFEYQKKLWEQKPRYVEQLLFLNDQLLAAIDRIIADSPRPPIIILESDHGPNLSKGLTREERRRIRFANFSAVLLPGAPAGVLPRDLSAVNLFRYIFNHYFDAGLPILPDRYFYSEFRNPYRIEEVTAAAARGSGAGAARGRAAVQPARTIR